MRLLAIMARLRDPVSGCPWDLEQDFASIVPYTIEEAYEVADAVDRQAWDELRDELGDLLLQVVFHARMAEEAGYFDFNDVVHSISAKMERRHPHVFGETRIASAKAQRSEWERHKSAERAAIGVRPDLSVLAGVEQAVPALTRARKLGRRASTVGFDWPDSGSVLDKVNEELAELDAARMAGDPAGVREELGDLLFAVANLARHLDADPEEALRQANRKFERRFRQVESRVSESGKGWDGHDLASLEALWVLAKKDERG